MPKNGLGNPAAPVTDTPSMPVISGLGRSSWTGKNSSQGPWLLYGAMSSLPGSPALIVPTVMAPVALPWPAMLPAGVAGEIAVMPPA